MCFPTFTTHPGASGCNNLAQETKKQTINHIEILSAIKYSHPFVA